MTRDRILEALIRGRVVFDGAGHRPRFDHPQQFGELMVRIATES